MPFSLQFGGKGIAPGQFGSEIHLDVDEAGRIFVSDTDNRRIQIFDSGGRLLHRVAASEKPVLEGEAFRFEEPREIAVAPNGHFFVADWQPLSVQDLWGWNVGLHVVYDSPESFMNHQYRYLDEVGDLIVTSSR